MLFVGTSQQPSNEDDDFCWFLALICRWIGHGGTTCWNRVSCYFIGKWRTPPPKTCMYSWDLRNGLNKIHYARVESRGSLLPSNARSQKIYRSMAHDVELDASWTSLKNGQNAEQRIWHWTIKLPCHSQHHLLWGSWPDLFLQRYWIPC